jgi:hypothetical protein
MEQMVNAIVWPDGWAKNAQNRVPMANLAKIVQKNANAKMGPNATILADIANAHLGGEVENVPNRVEKDSLGKIAHKFVDALKKRVEN